MSKYIITYKDYGQPGEKSTVTFTGVDLTDTNIVAQTAAADALRQAAEDMMLGGIQSRQFVAWVNETKIEPGDPFAQREIKWLVTYTDNVTDEVFSIELPCADLTLLDPDNSDKALMSSVPVQAFKSAFEAFQRSPRGNAVTLKEVLFVGRRS